MASYTRQSSFSDGDTISSSLFNNEYNQLVTAFSYASSGTTGHSHDGTAGEGGNIPTIGDQDFLNKITVDSTNNRWGFYVQVSSGTVEQLRIQDGAIVPVTNNDIDLGTSSLEFKDLFIDGTANIDSLVADTVDINGGTVDSAIIGGTTPAAITGTAITATGIMTATGTSVFASLDISGDIDVDGTANLDAIDIDGAVQADGTITVGVDDIGYDVKFFGATTGKSLLWDESADSLIVTGNSTVSGTLGVTGVLTGTSLDISGDIDVDGVTNLDVVDIDGAVDMASTLSVAGVLTAASLDISGDIDVDGTTNLDAVDIDGAVNMATTLLVTGNVDFNGDLDVDGTTNLDVVDIDGAVDIATTLTVGGNVDFNGDLDVDGTIEFDAISGTGSVTITDILDQDDMLGNSATALATQQSIKAYVDTQITAEDLDITTDSGTIAIDLDSETLTVSGGTGLDSSATGNAVTLAIDSTVATLTGSQTLTNKSLTAPTLTGTAIVASLDISGNIDVDGTTNLDVVDIDGAVDFASTTAHAGNATFADNAKAIFGAGSDLQIYHDGSNSYITDVGTGELVIRGSNAIKLGSHTGELYFNGVLDAEVTLYHNNSSKLATTATGIDVTGTATMDGLTVDGTASIKRSGSGTAATIGSQGSTNNPVVLVKTDESGNSVSIGVSASASYPTFYLQNAQKNYLSIGTGGDISFYEDTGTTAKLTWSSSNESLSLSSDSAYVVTNAGKAINGLDIAGAEGSLGSYGGAISFGNGRTGRSAIAAVQGHATDGDANGLAFFTHGSSGSTADSAKRMEINSVGDVSFYDNSGAAKLTWDASAEDLKFSDNVKAKFGAGDDLQIYSDGTNSYIDESGAGQLYIQATNLRFKSLAGENFMALNENGAVTSYYDNAVKLATTSTGIDVTGTATADGLTVGGAGLADYYTQFRDNTDYGVAIGLDASSNGGDGSLLIHGGISKSIDFTVNASGGFGAGTPSMTLSDTGNVGIGTSSPETPLHIDSTGAGSVNALQLKRTNGADSAYLRVGVDADANLVRYISSGSVGGSHAFNVTNSSEAMRISSAGLVGIGTSNPQRPLHLSIGTANTAIRVETTDTEAALEFIDTAGTAYFRASGDYIKMGATQSDSLTILAGGNVGIGTSSPATLLEVVGTDPVLTIRDTETSGASTNATLRLAESNGVDVLGHYWDINHAGGGALVFKSTTANEAVRIDSAGNVGIGTSTPNKTLEISKSYGATVRISNSNATVGAGEQLGSLEFYSNDGSGNGTGVRGFVKAVQNDGLGRSYDLLLGTGNQAEATEKVRITKDGLMGIGTDSPSAKLDIRIAQNSTSQFTSPSIKLFPSSTTNTTGFTGITYGTSTADNYGWSSGSLRTSTSADVGAFVFNFHNNSASGSEKMRISSAGNVGIGESNPEFPLDIQSDSQANAIQIIGRSSDNIGQITFTSNDKATDYLDIQTSASELRFQGRGSIPMTFRTADTERARFDSSGNFLVGKASNSANDVGGILRPNGQILGTADDDSAAVFTRNTSAGEVISIRNGTTAVGSIGGTSGSLFIDGTPSTGAGLQFGATSIVPRDNGIATTGAVDLGLTGVTFKDLYLSNKVYANYIGSSGDTNTHIYFPSSDQMRFTTGGSERARFDSSGNFMVGKTALGTTTAGQEFRSSGTTYLTTSAFQPLSLTRLTSDGDILQFRKDGTTVGSIGARIGDLYIGTTAGTTDNYIRFAYDTSFIVPCSSVGAVNDAAISLGHADSRFQNAYLSGGIYLGGTGAANKLDDYESGTWTPTITGVTTAGSYSSVVTNGTYTKVGNLVTASMVFYGASGTGAGDMRIGGLPFSLSSTATALGVVQGNSGLVYPSGTTEAIFTMDANSTYGAIRCNKTDGSAYAKMQYPTTANYIRFSVSYIAA